MQKPKKIIAQLEIEEDEQVKQYLQASVQMYEQLLQDGELPDPKYAELVSDVKSEEIADSVYRLKSKYPFVEDFTLAEFHVFASVVDAHLSSVVKRRRGRPKKSEEDASNQMRADVELIRDQYPGARINQLTRKLEYLKDDEWHVVQGNELDMIYIHVALRSNVNIQPKRAKDIFEHLARSNPFEPTVELMDYCRSQHPDLTKEEAHKLLYSAGSRLFGVFEGEPLVDKRSLRDLFFAKFLLNMALLARNPGSIPTWIPILIGEQGCGKSQLCRNLLPEAFASLFTPISNTLEQLAREQYRLHVGFLLELPEIDALMVGRKSTEWMKNLVTSPEDEVRFCYHAQTTSLVRRFGFIGTTNREDIFRDGTGSYERRYIPIQIASGFKIPWEEMRDGLSSKLWAAADLIAEDFDPDDGELKAFSDKEVEALTVWQQNYTAVDPWESRLMSFIQMRQEFTSADALTYIDVPIAQQTQASIRRINALIKKKLGARANQRQVKRQGERFYVWKVTDVTSLETQTLSKIKASDF